MPEKRQRQQRREWLGWDAAGQYARSEEGRRYQSVLAATPTAELSLTTIPTRTFVKPCKESSYQYTCSLTERMLFQAHPRSPLQRRVARLWLEEMLVSAFQSGEYA